MEQKDESLKNDGKLIEFQSEKISIQEEESLRKILQFVPNNDKKKIEKGFLYWKKTIGHSFANHLMKLSFKNIELNLIEYLDLIGKNCPQLYKISIYIPNKIENDDLKNAFSTIKSVKDIEFHIPSNRPTIINMITLLESVTRNLKKISFIWDPVVDNKNFYSESYLINFQDLFREFNFLEEITLKNFNICTEMMQPILTSNSINNTSNLSSIKTFKIIHSNIDEILFKRILLYCTKLESLIISNSNILYQQKSLKNKVGASFNRGQIKSNCIDTLKEFELSKCIDDSKLTTGIIPEFVNLKILKINGMELSVETCLNISLKCKSLVSLNLKECSLPTGQVFLEFIHLSKIENFNICNISIDDEPSFNISRLNNSAKEEELKKMELFIKPPSQPPNLIQLDKLKNLTNLDVQFIDKFNDYILMHIVVELGNLKKLNCSYCKNINDYSVNFAIGQCKTLEQFYIVNTNTTVEKIIQDSDAKVIRKNNIVLNVYISQSSPPMKNVFLEKKQANIIFI